MASSTWSSVSTSPAATRRIAAALGGAVDPLPRGGLFVSLVGDLGAGKTVFAGGLFRGLGVPADRPVVSPTFTVARAYLGRMPVHHLDAYHLKGLAELEAAGFEEMGGDGRVTCVEWGDRVPDALPADRLEVVLTPIATSSRGPSPLGAVPAEPPRHVEIRALGRTSTTILERARPALDASNAGTPAR